ncbi:hypothetical protein ACO34A_20575 [Rhizobium sp. ACO-34A]|nr:hypothetical protein ACO34A_20575 [Rhizobium sp. ACO-34A]
MNACGRKAHWSLTCSKKQRVRQAKLSAPPLEELSEAQIKVIGDVYFAHLMEEDEERRLSGFEGDDFDDAVEWLEALPCAITWPTGATSQAFTQPTRRLSLVTSTRGRVRSTMVPKWRNGRL